MYLTTPALSKYVEGQLQILDLARGDQPQRDVRVQGEVRTLRVETGERGLLTLQVKFSWLARKVVDEWARKDDLDHTIILPADYRVIMQDDGSLLVGKILPDLSRLLTFFPPGDTRLLRF